MRRSFIRNKGIVSLISAAAAALVLLVSPLASATADYLPHVVYGPRGFTALGDDATGVIANPAGLLGLEERGLRLQTAISVEEGVPAEDTFAAYTEPDTGVGAGALSLHDLPGGTRYAYSVAKGVGSGGAIGANLTYTAAAGARWWGLDLGYRQKMSEGMSVGAVVTNALSSSGSAPFGFLGGGGTQLPRSLAIGVAAENQEGLAVAFDYLDGNLESSADDPAYRYGVSLLGESLGVWGAQTVDSGSNDRTTTFGFSITFSNLTLLGSIVDGEDQGRMLSAGFAAHF